MVLTVKPCVKIDVYHFPFSWSTFITLAPKAITGVPPMTKSIATLLGMTHETFYRKTKDLENEGLVRFDKQRVEILNRPLLKVMIE